MGGIFVEAFKDVVAGLAPLSAGEAAYMVENRIDQIKQYERAGFSHKDAIMMTFDSAAALRRMMELGFNISIK